MYVNLFYNGRSNDKKDNPGTFEFEFREKDDISINKNESVVFIVEINNAIKGLIVLTPRESFDTLELHCWATVVKPPLKLTDYWDWIKFQAKCLGAKKITLETNRPMGRKFKFLKEVYTKYEVRV